MTLEQTTRLILAASESQDLAALQTAAAAREVSIATLSSMPPTEELRAALWNSLKAGEEAKRTIRRIRQRLERIESGFVRAQRPAGPQRIDCRG